MSDTTEDCIFCSIAAGDLPATLVHQSDHSVAFRDVDPQAPTHVLVVPRRHVPTVVGLAAAAPDELVDLVRVVGTVAKQEGLGSGYRTVANTGPDAQQSVSHAHLHVLGGRSMTWPPG